VRLKCWHGHRLDLLIPVAFAAFALSSPSSLCAEPCCSESLPWAQPYRRRCHDCAGPRARRHQTARAGPRGGAGAQSGAAAAEGDHPGGRRRRVRQRRDRALHISHVSSSDGSILWRRTVRLIHAGQYGQVSTHGAQGGYVDRSLTCFNAEERRGKTRKSVEAAVGRNFFSARHLNHEWQHSIDTQTIFG